MIEKVRLSSEVYRSCLTHALSTSKEEVMGLLVGEVFENETFVKLKKNDSFVKKEKNCSFFKKENDSDEEQKIDVDSDADDVKIKTVVLEIVGLKILQRSDKRKDRVEISNDQLIESMEYADKLKIDLKRPDLRIVSWYHSHPRITVWPSVVDLRTQANYQVMDKDFVGLIFSVFDTSVETMASQFELTCFQSERDDFGEFRRVDIEVEIFESSPEANYAARKELYCLPEILISEETALRQKVKQEDWLKKRRNNSALQLASDDILDLVARPLLEQSQAEEMILGQELEMLEIKKKKLIAALAKSKTNIATKQNVGIKLEQNIDIYSEENIDIDSEENIDIDSEENVDIKSEKNTESQSEGNNDADDEEINEAEEKEVIAPKRERFGGKVKRTRSKVIVETDSEY